VKSARNMLNDVGREEWAGIKLHNSNAVMAAVVAMIDISSIEIPIGGVPQLRRRLGSPTLLFRLRQRLSVEMRIVFVAEDIVKLHMRIADQRVP
jgi:hypothetical protein